MYNAFRMRSMEKRQKWKWEPPEEKDEQSARCDRFWRRLSFSLCRNIQKNNEIHAQIISQAKQHQDYRHRLRWKQCD